jgi:hypothetical protein
MASKAKSLNADLNREAVERERLAEVSRGIEELSLRRARLIDVKNKVTGEINTLSLAIEKLANQGADILRGGF